MIKVFRKWRLSYLRNKLSCLKEEESQRTSMMETMAKYGAMYFRPLSRNQEVVDELKTVKKSILNTEKKIMSLEILMGVR